MLTGLVSCNTANGCDAHVKDGPKRAAYKLVNQEQKSPPPSPAPPRERIGRVRGVADVLNSFNWNMLISVSRDIFLWESEKEGKTETQPNGYQHEFEKLVQPSLNVLHNVYRLEVSVIKYWKIIYFVLKLEAADNTQYFVRVPRRSTLFRVGSKFNRPVTRIFFFRYLCKKW